MGPGVPNKHAQTTLSEHSSSHQSDATAPKTSKLLYQENLKGWQATGGTMVVESITGGSVGFKLVDVAMTGAGGTFKLTGSGKDFETGLANLKAIAEK